MQTNAHRDALLSPQSVRTLVPHYVGRHDLSDPHISPLDADLRGLPPILLQVGADEILLDDSTRFNECASEAGGDVTLEIWPHMWHVWHVCAPYLPEANQAIGHIAEFVRKHLLQLQ
jgi:acetyl esterase/lipase